MSAQMMMLVMVIWILVSQVSQVPILEEATSSIRKTDHMGAKLQDIQFP